MRLSPDAEVRAEGEPCPSCGEPGDPRYRFCVHCGAEVALPAGTEGIRRVVTVLVSDLKGSTALGERLDAEALREVMSRYIEEMRHVVEAHGGRVEKIIGDAIVAVFGLAGTSSDHPDRGVAAADRARHALEELNDELERDWGVRLVARTGVCTGEVLIGRSSGGHRIMAGEAMVMAEAMEQRAPPMGVLLAESTRLLVGASVDAEPVVAPGKDGTNPLPGHRLESIVTATIIPAGLAPADGPPVCPECGEADDARAKWCGWCGAILRTAPPSRETRRTLTIVFADARTRPVEGPPPGAETLRAARWSYFEVMRGILERHGATVEKYIGDAIMAVFGLPRRTEDDALRAVKAAAEMQAALAGVNATLRQEYGLVIDQRIGVNTGNVIAGDAALGQRLVTGDAVNVAARFEQAASAGEVLLGEPTLALVRSSVEIEALEPLELRGKAAFVRAFRLMKVGADATRAERLEAPMVGRDAELAALAEVYDRAAGAGETHMVTILGDAGVGKSRLGEEFIDLATRSGARVLRGRCLSYGEGITFLPMVEILREAAGIGGDDPVATARAKLDATAGGLEEDVAERVAALMGLSEAPYQLAELFWGVRRLLEALGREGPLVVHLDDAHWAEETLLDLVEHLADAGGGAPRAPHHLAAGPPRAAPRVGGRRPAHRHLARPAARGRRRAHGPGPAGRGGSAGGPPDADRRRGGRESRCSSSSSPRCSSRAAGSRAATGTGACRATCPASRSRRRSRRCWPRAWTTCPRRSAPSWSPRR